MSHSTRLPCSQRFFFGVGHCFNDLAASVWFSYLIVYLQLVLGFDPNYAGLILLIGQVADALATPLLGYEVSNVEETKWCKIYGKRKFLHLIGTILVAISFPFVFIVCPGCEDASEFAFTIMLIPLVILFQVGWAAVQISHLSLIPTITPHESERDYLNVLRYAVDIISDISTYLIVWAVFDLTRKPTGDHNIITGDYANKFLLIVVVVEIIGLFFSVLFHVGVKENQHCLKDSEKDENTPILQGNSYSTRTLSWKGWLKEIHFYQVGLVYTCVRLFQNMSCVFMPLYLQESLRARDDFIAKIPLVMNISGFLISITLTKFFKVFSKKVTFIGGAFIGVVSCAWVAAGDSEGYRTLGIYGVGLTMGAASSILVVSAFSFIHDLIGTSVESGAFVYGCMSFCDKLANGIAGMIVQHMHTLACNKCDWFYRNVLSYGVGSTAVVGTLVLLFLPSDLSKRQSSYNRTVISATNGALVNYKSVEDSDKTKLLLESNLHG